MQLRGWINIRIKKYWFMLRVGIESVYDFFRKKYDKIVLLDPSINTQNLGDCIINLYCQKALSAVLDGTEVHIPTHTRPNKREIDEIAHTKNSIVCGTNLMTSAYEVFTIWKMPKYLRGYRNIVTLGVGWGRYENYISNYSAFVYRTILSKKALHSVRDNYTKQMFEKLGFYNVINTGCPTIWGLTKDHCGKIPIKKADRVIVTITDYDRDYKNDKALIEILLQKYITVVFWPQGEDDMEYWTRLDITGNVCILERSVDAFTAALKTGEYDYVGTRLHAGIHALNNFVRSIIIAIDNRATEMGKDFNLPVIQRSNIVEELPNLIENWKCDIRIPEREIECWKEELRKLISSK